MNSVFQRTMPIGICRARLFSAPLSTECNFSDFHPGASDELNRAGPRRRSAATFLHGLGIGALSLPPDTKILADQNYGTGVRSCDRNAFF